MSHDQESRDAVDYVSGILLYNRFIMLRNMIDVRKDVMIDYDPLLIEEDPELKIYFDMSLNGITDE